MARRSLNAKILIALTLAYTLVAVGSFLAEYAVQESALHQQLVKRAVDGAELLASASLDPMSHGNTLSINTLISQLQSEGGLSYAEVIDNRKHVVGSTRPADVGKHVGRMSFAFSARSHTLPNGDVVAVAPITIQPVQYLWGMVRVRVSSGSIDGALKRALLIDVAIRLAGAILFVLLALWLARSILEPLQRLVRATERIRTGDYETLVPIDTQDEIGMLSAVFNDMMDALRQRVRNLAFLADAGSRLASLPGREVSVAGPLLDELRSVLEADGVVVYDRSDGDWKLDVSSGLSIAAIARIGMALRALPDQEARVRVIPDVMADPLLVPLGLDSVGVASLLLVHTGQGGSRGLAVASSRARTYGREKREVALNFASQLAIARENERLFRSQQEAIQVKDQFLSVVSHELRTPLTAIKGYAELLLQSDGERGSRRFTETIVRQSSRLNTMVDELLDVTRMDRRQFTLDRQTVCPSDLVTEVVEHFRLAEPGRPIELAIQPDMPAGNWDRGRIEQVLSNLISNAIKYSDGEVTVSVIVEGDSAAITVADCGIGIVPEDVPHVFERFFRGKSGDERVGGMGIGLYVVQRIVQEHGGAIHVVSEPGKGSAFTVTLPLTTPSPSQVAPEPAFPTAV